MEGSHPYHQRRRRRIKSESYNTKVKYLVTGAAGFIGFFLSIKLLDLGCWVLGIDNLNEYYDVNLKYSRLEQLKTYANFEFRKEDIANKKQITGIILEYKPDVIIHLAAQAGVRYSLEHPDEYIHSNVIGFYNILEACRIHPIRHLVYASSSSVYGSNRKVPFKETDCVEHPVSLYGATKKMDELMADTYSHLYAIPITGLRFFTVYGPMGRPDMAYYSFTQKYFSKEPIHIYNNGDFEQDMSRDFTYIDDVVEGIERVIHHLPQCPCLHKIYNIGNNKPEKLMAYIAALEGALSKSVGREVKFEKVFEAIKPGDVPVTYACIDLLEQEIGFKPTVSIQEGLQRFADWYVKYYQCI